VRKARKVFWRNRLRGDMLHDRNTATKQTVRQSAGFISELATIRSNSLLPTKARA
jgi:hypothetical protein